MPPLRSSSHTRKSVLGRGGSSQTVPSVREPSLPNLFRPMEPLDADLIIHNLWMGSAPPSGESVGEHGFDVIVLCAEEFQPESEEFPGVKVIHAGIDDTENIPRNLFEIAEAAADEVVEHVKAGDKVLVTCWAGLNRSGLVTAWALHKLKGWSGRNCIRHVKDMRLSERKWDPYAMEPLHNKAFNKKLLELKQC